MPGIVVDIKTRPALKTTYPEYVLSGFTAFLFSIMLSITLLEFFYTTGCIYEFLFPCKKRMTSGTDFNFHLRECRTKFDLISTSAYSADLMIFRMDTFFHDTFFLRCSNFEIFELRNFFTSLFKHKRTILTCLCFFSTKNRNQLRRRDDTLLAVHGVKKLRVCFMGLQFVDKKVHAVGRIH